MEAWQAALKRNKLLTRQLERTPKEIQASEGVHFELIDRILDELRLYCVQTIWADLQYAKSERTVSILWTAHTSINHHYRRLLGRLKASDKSVERRRAEKSYTDFLRIALQFYKGLFQRLASRYDIPELKRLVAGIDLEQMDVGEDRISPVPDDITADVLRLCHSTLLHMGDLSRYRVQARHKKSSYNTALAYYSIAHDLNPNSGFAFHQMGIVQLDEGKYLEIVYNFYRAWVVQEPHPNAEQNLKSVFKNLMQSTQKTNANAAPARPYNAFSMWFAKLHAFFYQGEDFPQHEELETEVVHRLQLASKSTDTGEVLMKMILINIAAYYIACKKFTGTKSESASRFCHYTLRLSVRFILVFSEVLLSELTEVIQRETIPGDEVVMATPLIEAILPLLRTYMPWLTAHRTEIFGASEAFGNLVPDMARVLAKVFTLLCTDVYSQHLAPCPYMLFEDLETRGFIPMRDEQIPESCRFYNNEEGEAKPRLYSKNDRLEQIKESLGRILDILRCGYFLAGDASVPLSISVGESALTFEYQEAKANSIPQIPEALPAPSEFPVAQSSNQVPFENQGKPLGDQDMSLEIQEVSLEHQGIPFENQRMPLEDQGMSFEDQEMPLEDQEISLDHQGTPFDNQGMPLEDEGMLLEDQEMPLEDQEMPLEDQEMPLEDQEMPLKDQEMPLEHQGTPSENQGIPLAAGGDGSLSRAQSAWMVSPGVAPQEITSREMSPPEMAPREVTPQEVIPREMTLRVMPPPEMAVVEKGMGLEPEYHNEPAIPTVDAHPGPPTNDQSNLGYADESSYGMHSLTANEIFGQLPTVEATPKSAKRSKFDPLPWSWFYTPTPNRANNAAMDAIRDVFSAPESQIYTPTKPKSTVKVVEDTFTTPVRHPQAEYAPQTDYNPHAEHNPQTEYNPQIEYNPQSGYNPQAGYTPQSGYTPQAGYMSQAGYTTQAGYTPQTGYALQPASNMMAYPPQPNVGAEEAHRHQLLQSFQPSSAKRTSPFSSWGENSTRKPKETIPSGHVYPAVPEGYHMSSGISAFSHPSSLYQGTPANSGNYSGNHSGNYGGNHNGNHGGNYSGNYSGNNGSGGNFYMPSTSNPDRGWRGGSSPPRDERGRAGSNFLSEVDNATSNYDAAIFQAAFAHK